MANEEKQPQRSLVKKLAEIMGEVERVPKSGRNEFHRYDYATEADIAAAVRKGMASRSVMLVPSVEKAEWSDIPTKSGTQKLCTLTVRFTLMDGDSGESLEYVILGQGTDTSDKASFKALTGAEKYALLKLFLIPTGDDPEQDSTPPRRQQQAPQRQQQPVPTAATPAAPTPLALRISAVWSKAKAGGATKDAYRGWCAEQLGRDVPSAQWTEEDVSKLERAVGT